MCRDRQRRVLVSCSTWPKQRPSWKRRSQNSAVQPLASGARPARRAIILPWEVQRTMMSSAKVSPMRDMLPAGEIILIPIQTKRGEILKMVRFHRCKMTMIELTVVLRHRRDTGRARETGRLWRTLIYPSKWHIAAVTPLNRDEEDGAFTCRVKRRCTSSSISVSSPLASDNVQVFMHTR